MKLRQSSCFNEIAEEMISSKIIPSLFTIKEVFRKPTRPSLPLKKGVLKSSRPSLPLKKAPPFSPSLSSLRDERM